MIGYTVLFTGNELTKKSLYATMIMGAGYYYTDNQKAILKLCKILNCDRIGHWDGKEWSLYNVET